MLRKCTQYNVHYSQLKFIYRKSYILKKNGKGLGNFNILIRLDLSEIRGKKFFSLLDISERNKNNHSDKHHAINVFVIFQIKRIKPHIWYKTKQMRRKRVRDINFLIRNIDLVEL